MADKILIVDDDPDTVKYLSLFLKKIQYKALQAFSGAEALKIAEEQHPDLIILDVMMPEMDGYEVARRLRTNPDTSEIPILMLTAKSSMEDKLAGYESGVNIYLSKPVHPVELQANIKALLTQKISQAAQASRGVVVGVIAAKGGLGVSTLTLNLAFAYQKTRKDKAIAAEMNSGHGSWAIELDISTPQTLENLLGKSSQEITQDAVEKQLATTMHGSRLLLAASSPFRDSTKPDAMIYKTVIQRLSQLANMVIIDIGTHHHPAYASFLQVCDQMIVVTDPHPITVDLTQPLITDLMKHGFGSTKTLTLVTVNRSRAEITMKKSEIEEVLGFKVAAGFSPVPELSFQAATHHTPIYILQPDGIIAQQFNTLASQLETR